MQQEKSIFSIKNKFHLTALSIFCLIITCSSSSMEDTNGLPIDQKWNLERIKSIIGPNGSIASMIPSNDSLKKPINYLSEKIKAAKDKIPDEMKSTFYWKYSFINGRKTNGAFAILATKAFPFGSKESLALQTLFLIKNIICMRLFSNNHASKYWVYAEWTSQDPFKSDGIFMNYLIGPYSALLFLFSAVWGIYQGIAVQLANQSNPIQISTIKSYLKYFFRFIF